MSLKDLRMSKGLSQEEVASACNIGRSTVSMIELGKNKPSVIVLISMAKLFSCSLDDLVKCFNWEVEG